MFFQEIRSKNTRWYVYRSNRLNRGAGGMKGERKHKNRARAKGYIENIKRNLFRG